MTDSLYPKLVRKMTEVAIVSPQTVGPFTLVYKKVTPYFKEKPWKILLLTSLTSSLILYFIFGPILVRLASLLQFGF